MSNRECRCPACGRVMFADRDRFFGMVPRYRMLCSWLRSPDSLPRCGLSGPIRDTEDEAIAAVEAMRLPNTPVKESDDACATKYLHWEKVIKDLIRERDYAIAVRDVGNAWRKAAHERLDRIVELEDAANAVIKACEEKTGLLYEKIQNLRCVVSRETTGTKEKTRD